MTGVGMEISAVALVFWAMYALIFIVGLSLGSFASAVALRTINGQSWIRKQSEAGNVAARSECPHCKHQLFFLDLIPVLSWAFLQGKCRYCSKKISKVYPVLEILSGLSLLFFFVHRGIHLDVILFAAALPFIMATFFILLKHSTPPRFFIWIIVVCFFLTGLSFSSEKSGSISELFFLIVRGTLSGAAISFFSAMFINRALPKLHEIALVVGMACWLSANQAVFSFAVLLFLAVLVWMGVEAYYKHKDFGKDEKTFTQFSYLMIILTVWFFLQFLLFVSEIYHPVTISK